MLVAQELENGLPVFPLTCKESLTMCLASARRVSPAPVIPFLCIFDCSRVLPYAMPSRIRPLLTDSWIFYSPLYNLVRHLCYVAQIHFKLNAATCNQASRLRSVFDPD